MESVSYNATDEFVGSRAHLGALCTGVQDAYIYVRFLRMLVRTFMPIWLLSWVILFPVDAVKTQVAGKSGLEKLTFGNIEPSKQSRLWAHLILAWVFTC
jgi:hypothetical protein